MLLVTEPRIEIPHCSVGERACICLSVLGALDVDVGDAWMLMLVMPSASRPNTATRMMSALHVIYNIIILAAAGLSLSRSLFGFGRTA